jgi:hypothetical protein
LQAITSRIKQIGKGLDRPRELPGSDMEPLGQTTLGSCRGRRNDISQELTAGTTVQIRVGYEHLTKFDGEDEEVLIHVL